MKKAIIIAAIILVVLLITYFINKSHKKKNQEAKEMDAFGGMSRSELKRDLENAWKDRYFEIMTTNLTSGKEPYEIEWRSKINERVTNEGITFEQGVLEAVQFGWASGNPKAHENKWSAGWLAHVYLKDVLGLDPNDPDVKLVLNEI